MFVFGGIRVSTIQGIEERDMTMFILGLALGSGLVLAYQELQTQRILREQRRQAEIDEAVKLANEEW
jgi:hypothetical protein